MEEKRREDIKKAVEHFRGKAVNRNVLTEYCNVNHVEPIGLGDLEDYTAQIDHDELVGKMFPLMLAELTKLQYAPQFAPVSERKAIGKANDEVRIAIAKLFEEYEFPYQYISGVSEELGNMVGGVISSAGTTIFNKGSEVLLHIAVNKFGGTFTAKHAADYAAEVINKAFDKKEE